MIRFILWLVWAAAALSTLAFAAFGLEWWAPINGPMDPRALVLVLLHGLALIMIPVMSALFEVRGGHRG